MKVFAPDYYNDFKCIAENCKHSCCIGWEIDIDSDTADFYKSVPGEFGKKLCENIDFYDNGGSFRLCENERCPFLNERGLCDIYINLGEESLSQICSDHPRFRNFYESRTEIGLGICCEEAARLILEKEDKTTLVEISDDGIPDCTSESENEFFALREKIFSALQNRESSIKTRINYAFGLLGSKVFEVDITKWTEICLKLERLDDRWTKILKNMISNPSSPEIFDTFAEEQLLFYFVFRHFCDEYRYLSLCFSVLSFYMVKKASEQVGIFEAARLWSSEIEYSDENKDKILDIIYDEEVVL